MPDASCSPHTYITPRLKKVIDVEDAGGVTDEACRPAAQVGLFHADEPFDG
jgi:hypothetical protein